MRQLTASTEISAQRRCLPADQHHFDTKRPGAANQHHHCSITPLTSQRARLVAASTVRACSPPPTEGEVPDLYGARHRSIDSCFHQYPAAAPRIRSEEGNTNIFAVAAINLFF